MSQYLHVLELSVSPVGVVNSQLLGIASSISAPSARSGAATVKLYVASCRVSQNSSSTLCRVTSRVGLVLTVTVELAVPLPSQSGSPDSAVSVTGKLPVNGPGQLTWKVPPEATAGRETAGAQQFAQEGQSLRLGISSIHTVWRVHVVAGMF
jgi:hypothetical protein